MSEVEMSLAAETAATWQQTLTSDLSLLGNGLIKQVALNKSSLLLRYKTKTHKHYNDIQRFVKVIKRFNLKHQAKRFGFDKPKV
jgi:hypothetical protein